MKIHEYQARDLLSSFGIPVPAGSVIKDANDAANAYTEVTSAAKTDLAVLSAMEGSLRRGKAGFVKLVRSATEATAAADFMLSNKMVSA
ncbi:MAG: succinate--CoA ligase subunit beta, partial [Phycisphaerales bacterium]|nr:succinate--CoA ligase subunit beta [Phycisphaerales bacterium]